MWDSITFKKWQIDRFRDYQNEVVESAGGASRASAAARACWLRAKSQNCPLKQAFCNLTIDILYDVCTSCILFKRLTGFRSVRASTEAKHNVVGRSVNETWRKVE